MRNTVVFHTEAGSESKDCGRVRGEDWFVRVQYDNYRERNAPTHCLDVELDVEIVQGHYLEDVGPADGEAEIKGLHGGEHVWMREPNPLPAPITDAVRAIVASEGLVLQAGDCAILEAR